jgi:hypothetical protein
MDDKFTKSNFLRVGKEVLDFQMRNLYPVQVQGEPNRINLIFLNHDRNFSTFLTIMDLVKHERVADIYTLSRSMFESIISMGLLAKSIVADDLNRYQEYQFTEIHKTYTHLVRLGLQQLSGVNPSDANLVKQRSQEYINKYGRNLSTWTGYSLEDNVKLLDKNTPPTCNEKHFYEYLYCQVYRKGSSATHASFGGLSKGVEIETLKLPGALTAQRFKGNEAHLIFSCFHSILVFLSSVRFMGFALQKTEIEDYIQDMSRNIISE